jgi:NCAIR mutase (PurE)-related protein
MPDAYRAVKKEISQSDSGIPEGRIITTEPTPAPPCGQDAPLAICAAGTADLPVAEEAVLCARFWGYQVATYYDIGVAGLHRLLTQIDEIRKAQGHYCHRRHGRRTTQCGREDWFINR